MATQSADGQQVISDPADIGTQIMLQQKAAKAAGLPSSSNDINSSTIDPSITKDAFAGNVQMELNRMLGGSPGIISSDQARDEGTQIGNTLNGMDSNLSNPDMIPGPNGTMIVNPNSQSGIWGGAIYDEHGNLRNNNTGTAGASPTGAGDPMTNLLLDRQAELDRQQAAEELDLERRRDEATVAAKRAGDNSMGVSQLALLRSGGFSAMSGQAYLTSLANENRMKLHEIDMDYLDALRKAKNAHSEMDFNMSKLMIEHAEQLKRDFIAERAAQDAHLLSVQNIIDMKATNLEKKLEMMAKSGLTSKEVDPKLLLAFDADGGYAPGTTAHLLDFLAEQEADKKEDKTLDRAEKSLSNQLKIADLISKMPIGKSFFVDGKEYFGTASPKRNVSTQVELDENGNGTLVWINEDVEPGKPGFSGTVALGNIGAAKDNWIMAYDAQTGTTYRYNTQTQEANPIMTKGGFSNPANDANFNSYQAGLGDITQPFGVSSKEQPNGHTGVDIDNVEGTPILPFFPEGVKKLEVVAVEKNAKNGQAGYGNYVDLKDDQGNVWRYAHLRESEGGIQSVNVEVGQVFMADNPEKDTPLGWMGHTGSVHSPSRGDGSHLHLEKRAQINPLSLTTAAGQDRGNFPTGTGTVPLITDYAGAINKIGAAEIAQAKQMASSSEFYGKVNGAKNENVNVLLEQYAMGKSWDEIRDDHRHAIQSGDLGPDGQYSQYSEGIKNGMKGKSPTLITESIDQVDDALTRGDINGAKDIVIRAAEAGMYAATRQATIGQRNAIEGLNETEVLINYMEANDIDTGLLTGTKNQILTKLGKVGDPYLTQLAAQTLTNLQSYRASTTGKQFSQQETAEYTRLFPDATGEFELNTVRLNVLRDSLKRSLRTTFIDAVGNGVYYAIGLEDRIFVDSAGNVTTAPASTESDVWYEQYKKDHPELGL